MLFSTVQATLRYERSNIDHVMFAPNTATARQSLSTIPPPSSGRRRFWPFQLDVSLTTALALPLTLNRIFILAPYAYRTNRKHPDGPLVATRSAAAYSVTVLLVYVLTTAYLLYDFRHTTPLAIRLFGVIWYGLNTVDYVISKSSFILIGCVSLYKRRRQIEFFVAISRIDKRLRSRCGCSGRRFYNRLAVGYAIMLAVCASIVFISYLTVLQPLAILGLAVASRVILIVMYVVEYSNVLLLYCSFVSSTLMVRARLLLLTGALRAERGSSRAVADLGDALYVYTELCRMIELLGDYFGGMMLMRFAHDFMLCTAAAYNICSLLMLIQHQSPMSFSLLGGVGLLVLHLLQPVSVCVAAELTLAAVS